MDSSNKSIKGLIDSDKVSVAKLVEKAAKLVPLSQPSQPITSFV